MFGTRCRVFSLREISTPDLSKPGEGVKMISTQAFGDLVVSELDKTPIPA